MQPAYHLPGVFQANALPAVNGSLWTIPYEVLCYLLLMAAGVVGILGSRQTAARAALIYVVWYALSLSPDASGKVHYTFLKWWPTSWRASFFSAPVAAGRPTPGASVQGRSASRRWLGSHNGVMFHC